MKLIPGFFILVSLFQCFSSFSQTGIQTGKASYYSSSWSGRLTSSGDRLSNKNYTAAHRTLPFYSIVKVTDMNMGKSVFVKINDRGPFVKGRILDLSYLAAKNLEMLSKGVIEVKMNIFPVDSDSISAVNHILTMQTRPENDSLSIKSDSINNKVCYIKFSADMKPQTDALVTFLNEFPAEINYWCLPGQKPPFCGIFLKFPGSAPMAPRLEELGFKVIAVETSN